MAHLRGRLSRLGWLAQLAAACAAVPAAAAAPAQPASGAPAIWACTTADGRRLTADRPIPECLNREQRVLNRDGSLRRVEPPQPTGEERAAAERQRAEQAAAAASQQEGTRRDRLLLQRYPDEAAHAQARTRALEPLLAAIGASQQRLQALAAERRRLQLQPSPAAALADNQIAAEVQQAALQDQQAEAQRVNRLFDAELERLQRLWAGAALGAAASQPAPR